MVYTFSVGGGPLTFSFDVEADSRVEALYKVRSALHATVEFKIMTERARILRSCSLHCDDVSYDDIVDEWAGVTSVRPFGGWLRRDAERSPER